MSLNKINSPVRFTNAFQLTYPFVNPVVTSFVDGDGLRFAKNQRIAQWPQDNNTFWIIMRVPAGVTPIMMFEGLAVPPNVRSYRAAATDAGLTLIQGTPSDQLAFIKSDMALFAPLDAKAGAAMATSAFDPNLNTGQSPPISPNLPPIIASISPSSEQMIVTAAFRPTTERCLVTFGSANGASIIPIASLPMLIGSPCLGPGVFSLGPTAIGLGSLSVRQAEATASFMRAAFACIGQLLPDPLTPGGVAWAPGGLPCDALLSFDILDGLMRTAPAPAEASGIGTAIVCAKGTTPDANAFLDIPALPQQFQELFSLDDLSEDALFMSNARFGII
jgi:hypothetical protein